MCYRFEPTGDGSWRYLTGGTTDPALKGVREFVARFVNHQEWRFTGVRLRPRVPVHYGGSTVEEPLVAFDFERNGKRMSLYVDGFSWGYGGTGPMGLVRALVEICDQYEVYPAGDILREALRRWVVGCDQNTSHDLAATTIPSTEFMRWEA